MLLKIKFFNLISDISLALWRGENDSETMRKKLIKHYSNTYSKLSMESLQNLIDIVIRGIDKNVTVNRSLFDSAIDKEERLYNYAREKILEIQSMDNNDVEQLYYKTFGN